MGWWTLIASVIAVAGLVLYSVPVGLQNGRAEIRVGLLDLAVVVVVLAVLVIVHEGIHGLAMLAFHASPRFGATVMQKLSPLCTPRRRATDFRAAST